ncbi:sulfite exporter TauE/SafE family protein [Alteromonas sp. KUL49]|uniref:sulfite exporter TauE/SafE family protein n=1 Tax=Alteromonas sp. KUL49 TaxID=2480798 RepID=UPI0010FFC4A5|nr:sulfite exporter TauE/SafE family protein [Alteromonas sp. KUL49]GEA12222.1 hypothetical protein KUL49_25970 [Alteromonas sp. KUL49]
MTEWVFVLSVVVVGSALQNTIGFGFGLLCAPLFMHVMPELVPVPLIFASLLITSVIAAKDFKHVNQYQLKYSVTGGVIGVALAGTILASVTVGTYKLIFGILILVGVCLSVLGYSPKIRGRESFVAGSLAGFMGSLTSAGGAPMGILYQGANQKEVSANLNCFFVAINSAAIFALHVNELITIQHLTLFMQIVPAMIIGLLLSHYFASYLNSLPMRPLILFIASISALILVL